MRDRMDDEPGPGNGIPPVESWFDEMLPYLFGYFITRVGGRVHTAEDLTQETVLAAMSSVQPESAPLLAWLYGIARHKLIDHYRREERDRLQFGRPLDDSIIDIGPSPPLTGLDLDSIHTRDDIIACFDLLPPRQRSAMVLRYFDDCDVTTTARLLGLSEHATESLLGRARAAFRRHYHHRTGGTS